MTDDAFAQGILAMRDTLYRVSYGLLRSEHDRYDAVQEALSRSWEKRASLRDDALLKTWVVRILINECHSIQRRQHRVLPCESPPEQALPPPGAEQDLHDAVLALPDAYRLPVILHYMEGYSLREISSMLRMPVATVGTRLHRARHALRTALGESWEEEPHA